MKMYAWVRIAWDELSEESKKSLEKDSKLVVRYIQNPQSVGIALRLISRLMNQYPWIVEDIESSYDSMTDNKNETIVPYSHMQAIKSYFSQFIPTPSAVQPTSQKEPEVVSIVEEIYVGVKIGTFLKVKNDFYGDVLVQVTNITGSSYMCKYEKDGELIIKSWRIPKNSPRILQVIN